MLERGRGGHAGNELQEPGVGLHAPADLAKGEGERP